MAVIPFTYFKPGIWELQCSGDLMSDILGKSWQYNVSLRVLSEQTDEKVGIIEGETSLESDFFDDPESIADDNLVSATSAQSPIAIVDTVTVAVPTELAIATQNSLSGTDLLIDTQEDAVIDQPVSPVWFKGETAEQILQNLIDLALPTSDPLLEDETEDDSSDIAISPPLLLTLVQEAYVAHWGQALTVKGRVELDMEAEIPYPESLYGLAIEIELRSPLEAEILTKVRQPLLNQVLPFNITSSIDIPADCESKLILADISVYGGLTDFGEAILLASQSFTITADVTELLAITAATKSSTPDILDDKSAPLTSPTAAKEPEPSFSIDLALFNLVKTVKSDQSLPLNPSPNQSLPPQISQQSSREAAQGPSTVKKSADYRALQLPNFPPLPPPPPLPIEAIATAAVAEPPTAVISSPETSTAEPPTTEASLEKVETLATINLDQLVIKHRRVPAGSTFPYLKRLKVLPNDRQEINSGVLDTLDVQVSENSKEPDETLTEHQNTPEANASELVANDRQLQDESVVEIATPSASELIDESVAQTVNPPRSELIIEGNPYSSPLITKWLQSQGFSIPEIIHVPDRDYDTNVLAEQTMPDEKASVSSNPQILMSDIDLPLKLNDETGELTDEEPIKQEEIEIPTVLEAENITEEASALVRQDPPSLPPPHTKSIPAWLAQEIVVDDTYSEPEINAAKSHTSQAEEPALLDSTSLPITAAITEPLPIPQLYVPEGELIAGKFVKVQVELPEVSPQVVVKLWVEDCQTRWLLDGPYLLKNLQPNSLGGLEAITQLHIPFGCLELRVEAIALDMATQQESHKVTITRTVIPPDLPNLQLVDELLGI
jgi:hypothetical protein